VFGILYVATGNEHFSLFLESLEALRLVEPDVPVTVFSDGCPSDRQWDRLTHFGATVTELPNPSFSFHDKIAGMESSPYEDTIFFDTDTLAIRPFVQGALRALSIYPLIALPGMSLNHTWEESQYSALISQFNTGVVLYRQSDIPGFFRRWREIYEAEERPTHDQPSFRAAVIEQEIRVGPLAAELNFMGSGWVFEPRVLHFTAWRRQQFFYKSLGERNRLISRLSQPGYGAVLHDFYEVGSWGDVRGKSTSGKLLWWLGGAVRWMWARIFRYGRGGIRLITQITARFFRTSQVSRSQ